MTIFAPDNATKSPLHRRLYALYELSFTVVDVTAAGLFLVGSVMFFYAALQVPAIWCFVLGSACFALSPVLRLVREFHYLAVGDFDDLARRAEQ